MASRSYADWLLDNQERLGWGNEETARKAGTSPTTISNIISGKISHPHYRTLRKIAGAFGTEVPDPKAGAPSVKLNESGLSKQAELTKKFLKFGAQIVAGWESELQERYEAGDQAWFDHILVLYEEYIDTLSDMDLSEVLNSEESMRHFIQLRNFVKSTKDTIDPNYQQRFESVLEESGMELRRLVEANV